MSSLNTQIRKDIVNMVYNANSGHIGGSLSLVEIMHTLYFKIMNIDPKNPKMEGRDILIMSKGHASAVLYSTLAHRGYFSTDELLTYRKLGSRLQGHPSKKNLECIEASTGSLGQGICIAVGVALGYKLDKKDGKVFAIAGDGEAQEGTFWESAMAAANYKLDNYTLIIDNNGLQIDGKNEDVMCLGDLEAKMKAFGFETFIVDGHNEKELEEVFAKKVSGKPKCVIAKTVKGKGVSFMENAVGWHGKAPNKEEYERAMEELNKLD